MTRYHHVVKFLDKEIEYEHLGTNMWQIFIMDKGQEIAKFFWELEEHRKYDMITHEDIKKCLAANIDKLVKEYDE